LFAVVLSHMERRKETVINRKYQLKSLKHSDECCVRGEGKDAMCLVITSLTEWLEEMRDK
jgi:hypothetical protein